MTHPEITLDECLAYQASHTTGPLSHRSGRLHWRTDGSVCAAGDGYYCHYTCGPVRRTYAYSVCTVRPTREAHKARLLSHIPPQHR